MGNLRLYVLLLALVFAYNPSIALAAERGYQQRGLRF